MGYLYYRAAELENGNPWHEGMALSSLPVYRNAAYDASGLGIAKGLDEAQMRALLDSAVSALGAAVRSVETVTAEGADTVTELRAATDRGELRAQADGTLVYLLPDGGSRSRRGTALPSAARPTMRRGRPSPTSPSATTPSCA